MIQDIFLPLDEVVFDVAVPKTFPQSSSLKPPIVLAGVGFGTDGSAADIAST